MKHQVKHIKHDGNVTLDQVIDIARTMRERSMARTLAGTVKEMLGTCNSVGCTVNGQSPRDVQVGVHSAPLFAVFFLPVVFVDWGFVSLARDLFLPGYRGDAGIAADSDPDCVAFIQFSLDWFSGAKSSPEE